MRIFMGIETAAIQLKFRPFFWRSRVRRLPRENVAFLDGRHRLLFQPFQAILERELS